MRIASRWFARAASTALGLAMVLTAVAGSAHAGGGWPTPEIDPGSMSGALTLLVGGAFLLTAKSRKR
jgi:hypothetical protein